ncbi:MAG: substrate-binding domain-containing protein [Prevotella sp.]|uniref:LacI family DNA-binding transcriptional regulator n=1 Tax=Hallella TaxID=52228 RepID=UPI00258C6EE9|nr:substrate-binding domain-containing protein [Hallella sp.]MBS7400563.1 substrate-binding domain-containing protein [Prevotella sp.]MCI7433164.1 substrate-binding domain-containing protein [Prevotella sp.]MDD7145232.1 substrate-binding domain-containing protein [Hallella sp.]MED9945074.1 substrate-binding domain-containing protein [Hallella sp.]
MTEKIRIKDIAMRAGVSVGTVDRVLHERPNVSESARKKVEEALKEMNYQPNMYASALAYNRSYTFYVLIPKHDQLAYWEEIEEGVQTAVNALRDFHIAAHIEYYKRFDEGSFEEVTDKCLQNNPDGFVIVPTDIEVTRKFTDKLHEIGTPFVLLDSYMPDLRPLAFFGQNSFSSGYFAARMLMLIANQEKEIVLMKITKNGQMMSKQQDNREVGFRHYMRDHYPSIEIITLEMPFEATRAEYDELLENFFAQHPHIHQCITLGSRAHIMGDFLLRTNRRDVQIMGYDMVGKNAECLRLGSVSFLIAQHAYQQGYFCVNALFRAIVLKKKVEPVNYMPIELLTKENVDFYRREQL